MSIFLVKFKLSNKLYGEYVMAKNGFDALITAAQINQLAHITGAAIKQ